MQKKHNKNLLSLILSMMLIVAMAFHMTACGDNTNKETFVGTEGQSGSTEQDSQVGSAGDETQADVVVLGDGAMVFAFTVVHADGSEKSYEVHTDKTIVGEALLELELISGEDGPYGLYVKVVDGIALDYNEDGMYWSFYINGEYAMTGVDVTPITEGENYSFKAEKS